MKRLCFTILIAVALLGLLPSTAAAQSSRTPITVDNAAGVSELAMLGRGTGLSLEWSPGGDLLAVATTVGIWLYDGANLAAEPAFLPTTADVGAMAFSPDGSLLAASVGKLLLIWDPATRDTVNEFELESAGATTDMLFSPDASWVALASEKKIVRIVDVATGTVTATLEGHTNDVTSLALSPDGSILVSGSQDKIAKLWNTADFTEIATLEGHEGYVNAVLFNPDGSSIYVGDSKSTITQWDTNGVQQAVWAPEKGSYVVSMALTGDGATLLVGEGNNASVRVWDTASGTEKALYEVHFYPETNSRFATVDIALSPDDTTLATLGSEGMLRIWDAATGENLLTNSDHADEAWSVAFSPDGTQLSASYDLMAWRVWDPATYELLHGEMHVFRIGFTDNRTSNVYSPDGSQIAARSAFSIKVYDTATWEMIYEYEASSASVIYSPDGTLLIVVGKDLRVLDALTGSELARLENHTHGINSVAMNGDQTLIATASDDGTVRLWGLP